MHNGLKNHFSLPLLNIIHILLKTLYLSGLQKNQHAYSKENRYSFF